MDWDRGLELGIMIGDWNWGLRLVVGDLNSEFGIEHWDYR